MVKKCLLSVFVLLWIGSLSLSAQTLVSVNQNISCDTLIVITNRDVDLISKTVTTSGQAAFSSKSSGYVRILLSDDDGYDLLIYESMPLVATNGVDIFSNVAIESINVPSHPFTNIRIELHKAVLNNLSVDISDAKISIAQQQQERTDRIALMNRNLRANNALWAADETSVSKMSYEEKKATFGGKVPDLQGWDYYAGGIFELNSDSIVPVRNAPSSPYISSFDWRNRHGANNPTSPYYNGTNGWITSVKNQNYPQDCSSCWAFAALGSLEARVNLYFNRKINVDLSEQELVSCDKTNLNKGCLGGFSQDALYYIWYNGVIDETTFPYQAKDVKCSQKPTTSIEKIEVSGFNITLRDNFDEIKRDVIESPLPVGFGTWRHSVTVIGYKVLQEGDVIYLVDAIGFVIAWITIEYGDPRIGQTALLFKNSYGASWGDGGFGYIIANISDINDYVDIYPKIKSEIYKDSDIVCEDRDGDGYYYWGIGPKPATCPCWAPNEPDGDDSNPTIGPMDSYGNCSIIQHTNEVINTSQTWNVGKTVNTTVIIQPGATLTITSTILFSENGSIVVRPGGKLVVSGGILTASQQNKMWKGIAVLGNPKKQQLDQYQGKVDLKNNAVIEHALCAISAAPSSYCNAGGGIIKATDATFKNNLVAVEYRPYEYQSSPGWISDNTGKFTRCTFIKDNNNRFAANKLEFQNHIYMNQVRGVTFEGCDFKNTTTTSRGAGIRTLDAGVKVKNHCPSAVFQGDDCACPSSPTITTKSIFNNHAIGIYSNGTGDPRPIYVDQSEFISTSQGVRIYTQNNYRLTRCIFTDIQMRGLYSANSSGYRIEENSFSATVKNHSGIVIENSGIADNRIYKNVFSNLDRGINVQGNNGQSLPVRPAPGLQLICNEFNSNNYDIYIGINATVCPQQGSIPSGANNRFNTTSSTVSSIYSLGSQTIFYYHSPGNNHAPKSPTSNVPVNNTASANLCKSTFCINVGPGTDKTKSGSDSIEQYKAMQAQYDQLVVQLDENPELLHEILILSNAMRELSDHAISRILHDSILYLDELKRWYEAVRTPIAKYSLAEVHFYERKFDQAEVVLREIPRLFTFNELEMMEHNNYIQFYHFKKQLQLSERDWTQLTEEEIVQLRHIAEATHGRSSSMAKGVLCFFFDICYEDENFPPLFPSFEGAGVVDGSGEVPPSGEPKGSKTQTYELILYPNPTESEMTVLLNNPSVKIAEMEILDIYGKSVSLQPVNQFYGTLKMNKLANGIYILKVYLNQGDILVRKIVRK